MAKVKAITKKAAPQKAVSKNETGIKYTDKSPGQPGLLPIFEEIKNLLLPYKKGTMQIKGGTGGQITLISKKAVEIEGRKRDEIWFAGALIQKGYVGFYFVPVYSKADIKEVFKPELLKCLKGKSCFHIKKSDKEIFAQIKEALKIGYIKYKERGWV
jgi:hypothetical protein